MAIEELRDGYLISGLTVLEAEYTRHWIEELKRSVKYIGSGNEMDLGKTDVIQEIIEANNERIIEDVTKD